jgi:predicted ester cyclase
VARIAIETAFGCAEAFFAPAFSGLLLPQTVPEELIQSAAGLTQAPDNASLVIGPAVATALITTAGAGAAFMLDAATFLLSAALLRRVTPRQRGDMAPAARVLDGQPDGTRCVNAPGCGSRSWRSPASCSARSRRGRARTGDRAPPVRTIVGLRRADRAARHRRARRRPDRRPRAPAVAAAHWALLLLAWPLYGSALALGAPFWIAAPLAVAAGAGWALMRVVGNRARPPNPCRRALARWRVRPDRLARAAPRRLRAGRAARRNNRNAERVRVRVRRAIAFVIITLAVVRQPDRSVPTRRRCDAIAADAGGRQPGHRLRRSAGNRGVSSPVSTDMHPIRDIHSRAIDDVMTESERNNAELVRRHFEVIWNQGDLAAVDDFFGDEFTNFGRRAADARALIRAIVGTWRAAFPDLRFQIEDEIVRGDAAVHLVTCSGTHTGTFEHPAIGVLAPSGRSFAVDQIHITRVRDGRIAQHWGTRNDLAMLQQLGAVATPQTTGTGAQSASWQRSSGT